HEFRAAGFSVQQGAHVPDPITKVPREIDILAQAEFKARRMTLRIVYVIECKWSANHPWVIFTSHLRMSPDGCVSDTMRTKRGRELLERIKTSERLHHLSTFKVPDRPGFGGRQVADGNKDLFFEVSQKVVSAAGGLVIGYTSAPSAPNEAVLIFP